MGNYLTSAICGIEYDICIQNDLLISDQKSKPVLFFAQGAENFQPKYNETNMIYNGEYKWIIDCDEGSLTFYWNNTIWENSIIPVGKYLIDNNQTYYPLLELNSNKNLNQAIKLQVKFKTL